MQEQGKLKKVHTMIQYLVKTYREKNLGKKHVFVCVRERESLCCIPEANPPL